MNSWFKPVKIVRSVYDGLIDHAREEAPLECCGLLYGSLGVITDSRRMSNVLRSPTRYSMDPGELFAFFKDIRILGLDHLGIYHSHPRSEAYPSPTDIQEAYYPGCSYFIVSLRAAATPEVRAFRLETQPIQELNIELVESK